MGIVSDYLRDLIIRQVSEKGIVVWFDPERHYQQFTQALAIPDTTIACYEGSFFALRYQVDALLEGETPPHLVVYIPLAEEDTQHALIELSAAGVVLKPGHAARPRGGRPTPRAPSRWASLCLRDPPRPAAEFHPLE